MVIVNTPSRVLFGGGSRWSLVAILAAVLFITAFLIGYWSWLQEFREQIVTGFLMTLLGLSVVLIIVRVIAVAALVGMMVRALCEPLSPDEGTSF